MPFFNKMGFNQTIQEGKHILASTRLIAYTSFQAKNTEPQRMQIDSLISDSVIQVEKSRHRTASFASFSVSSGIFVTQRMRSMTVDLIGDTLLAITVTHMSTLSAFPKTESLLKAKNVPIERPIMQVASNSTLLGRNTLIKYAQLTMLSGSYSSLSAGRISENQAHLYADTVSQIQTGRRVLAQALLISNTKLISNLTQTHIKLNIVALHAQSVISNELRYNLGSLKAALLGDSNLHGYITQRKEIPKYNVFDQGFNHLGFNRRVYAGRYVPIRASLSTETSIQADNVYDVHQGQMRLGVQTTSHQKLTFAQGTFDINLESQSLLLRAHSWRRSQQTLKLLTESRMRAVWGRTKHISASLKTATYLVGGNMDPRKVKYSTAIMGVNTTTSFKFGQRWRFVKSDMGTHSKLLHSHVMLRFEVRSKMASLSVLDDLWITRKKAIYGLLSSGTYIQAVTQRTISDAINELSREWYSQVEIYFDGPDKAPTIIDRQMVDSFSILEELKSDTARSILGSVSSNELFLSLANINRALSPTNKQGPFYGKLLPNVIIKIRLFLRVTKELWADWVLGTFYTDDWKDQNNEMVITVRAYDRYYYLASHEFPGTRMLKNFTYYDLFVLLFRTINLKDTDYAIDPLLKEQRLRFSWIPQGTFAYAVQFLAQASNSFVYVNRNNTFIVRSLTSVLQTLPTAYASDTDQIIAMSIPTSYNSAFSKLEVDVVDPIINDGAEELVLELSQVDMPNGTYTLENCKFRNLPIAHITRIITNGKTTRVHSYTASTDAVTIHLENPGAPETITIRIFGFTTTLSTRQLISEESTLQKIIGNQITQIKNPLIQNMQYAQQVTDSIFPIMINPHANISMSIRGNPRIQLGTVVDALDVTNKVEKQRILIYRSTLSFAGGLSQELLGYNITN